LMGLAIGFAQRTTNFDGNLLERVFAGHGTPPQLGSMVAEKAPFCTTANSG
jgi:hypothetical protein